MTELKDWLNSINFTKQNLIEEDPDTIKIGSFSLNPSEFYLHSGAAMDIYVSFNPEKEGKLEENLTPRKPWPATQAFTLESIRRPNRLEKGVYSADSAK